MRTKTKHKFSVWFLFAGASMLLVALWNVIQPVINLIQGGLFYDYAVEWVLGEIVAGLLAIIDVGNILLSVVSFVVLATVLVLFAFRRVRWLLVVPSALLLWNEIMEFIVYVIETFALNEYWMQWGMGEYFEYYDVLDWGDIIFGVFFPPIAYLCLTVIAVLYTIPKTRVAARVIGHVPAVLFTGCWFASMIIMILGVLFGGYVSAFDLTPLPLVAGMWLLWVGILRERQERIPVYECTPAEEAVEPQEAASAPEAKEPVCEEKPCATDAAPMTITERDAAEAIRLYKKLLDEGAITEAEFNAKKKQLLNIQ